MRLINLTLPGYRIKRSLVYLLMTLIIILGMLIFGVSYMLNRTPTTFVPLPTITGPSQPRFSFMIYGNFGEGVLVKPMDVTASANRIYVSDTGNKRVQVFDYYGKFLFSFGEVGNKPGQFQFPYGIAVGRSGNVYVADLYLGKISVFSSQGEFIKYFGDEEGQEHLSGPGDIFIAEDGLIYVTDINRSKILVFDSEGKFVREFGQHGRGPGELYAPNGIAVDRDGKAYVVDTGNQRVQVFDKDGNPVALFNGSSDGKGDSLLVNPRGIGIRGSAIFVVSNLTHTVHAFDKKGQHQYVFGEMGNLNHQFTLPNGLFVDSNGRIYITDTVNQRVAVYR